MFWEINFWKNVESFSNLFVYTGKILPQRTHTPDMLNCLSGQKWVASLTINQIHYSRGVLNWKYFLVFTRSGCSLVNECSRERWFSPRFFRATLSPPTTNGRRPHRRTLPVTRTRRPKGRERLDSQETLETPEPGRGLMLESRIPPPLPPKRKIRLHLRPQSCLASQSFSGRVQVTRR